MGQMTGHCDMDKPQQNTGDERLRPTIADPDVSTKGKCGTDIKTGLLGEPN